MHSSLSALPPARGVFFLKMEKLRLSLFGDGDDGNEEKFVEGGYVSSSDEDVDGAHKHNQLLDAVRQLDGKNNRTRMVQRTEAGSIVSEFDLGNYEQDKLKVEDLLNSLGKTAIQSKLKRKLSKVESKAHVLPPPLKKQDAAKVKRIVAYNDVCTSLCKWDRVVLQNRHADQLSFPLKQTMLTMEPLEKVVKRCQVSTPLEKEIAELLQNRKPQIENVTDSHKDNRRQMDLEEAMEMRQEMSRMRAQQTYQEAKYRRKNKIKSKRYHRILKREKLKKELKDFEELQKTNPELAAEKFLELDNQRILERMTLRHRNTGKWAKYQLLRSKHDKESGRIIQEQIELNRTLTAKQYVPSDSDDEAATLPSEPQAISGAGRQNPIIKIPPADSSNPWMSAKKAAPNGGNFSQVSQDDANPSNVNYRRYWAEENDKKKIDTASLEEEALETNEENEFKAVTQTACTSKKLNELQNIMDEEKTAFDRCSNSNATHEMDEVDAIFDAIKSNKEASNDIVEESPKIHRRKRKTKLTVVLKAEVRKEKSIEETLVRKNTLEDFDNLIAEEKPEDKSTSILGPNGENSGRKAQDVDIVIDPNDFITVKQRVIKCKAPNMENYEDDAIDDMADREHHMTIVEAFADDDVIEEFKMEKQAIIERDTPKDIDLTLPGWGVWGGSGIRKSSKRQKRFIIKAPPAPLRKDSNIGNVILNENSEEKLRPHLVSKISFPYTTVEEFEKSIQTPIGKQWNPETAFRRMIAPKIVSKIGTIIEPMDADAIKGESSRTISYV